MTKALSRLAGFYEFALFEQKPFKYTREPEHKGTSEYLIYNDEDDMIYSAHFVKYKNAKNSTAHAFSFENSEGSMSITNSNRDLVFRVFSTIIKILQDYSQQELFGYITFSADKDEPSRIKLYDTIFNKFKKIYAHKYFFERSSSGWDVFYYIIDKDLKYNPATGEPRS